MYCLSLGGVSMIFPSDIARNGTFLKSLVGKMSQNGQNRGNLAIKSCAKGRIDIEAKATEYLPLPGDQM